MDGVKHDFWWVAELHAGEHGGLHVPGRLIAIAPSPPGNVHAQLWRKGQEVGHGGGRMKDGRKGRETRKCVFFPGAQSLSAYVVTTTPNVKYCWIIIASYPGRLYQFTLVGQKTADGGPLVGTLRLAFHL